MRCHWCRPNDEVPKYDPTKYDHDTLEAGLYLVSWLQAVETYVAKVVVIMQFSTPLHEWYIITAEATMQGHAKKWFAMLRQQSRRVEVGDVYLDPAHGGFQPYATEEDPTQDWNAFWVHAREMFVGRSFEVDLKKHMLDGLPLTEQRTDNFVLDSRLFLVEFELARECLQRLDRPISQDDALLAFAAAQ